MMQGMCPETHGDAAGLNRSLHPAAVAMGGGRKAGAT